MSLLLRSSRVLQKVSGSINPAAAYSSAAHHAPTHAHHAPTHMEESAIGNREIVGFGVNGNPCYMDRPDFPMPAIRYKAPTPEIQALKEKEKGDWKKLTIEEKKQLYRASFCQTFAELNAPTGEWKSIVGCSIGFLSLSLWIFMGLKLFVYPKELPKSLELESRQAQLQRMIDMRVNPIDGLTSKWDYEKGDWKK